MKLTKIISTIAVICLATTAFAIQPGDEIHSNVQLGEMPWLQTSVPTSITSIYLPCSGDWELSGAINFLIYSSPSITHTAASIESDIVLPGVDGFSSYASLIAPYNGATSCALPARRIRIAVPTTFYLVSTAQYTDSAAQAEPFGFISATLVRYYSGQ